MNKSVYSYNCVIFPGKLCAPAFSLTFVGWLWYVDTGQHLGACSLNGATRFNFQTWRGFIKLLLLVFSTAIVQASTLCWNRFGFVCLWHVGPFYSSLWMSLHSTQKDGKIFLDAVLEILLFSSQPDYPSPSHANPCPIVGGSANVKPLK